MKRDEELAESIERDFQDDGYFENIEPPWLGQEDESVFVSDTVPEMPRSLRVMDFDMDLADQESETWGYSIENDMCKSGQEEVQKDSKDEHKPAKDKKRRVITCFAQSSKPYNHEADSMEEACGITGESYNRFCDAFKATVGEARKQDPAKRSLEIEAFENLMMLYPRELAFYITSMAIDLYEYEYLRSVLRRLLRESRKKTKKEQPLESIQCAGTA